MVSREDCHVDDDIGRAEGLPAAAFTDRGFLERELATIFAASWQIVPERGDDPRPLDEQVSVRGARVPVTVLDRPLFLQRGWDDDTLRAFPNTCTHAWYPLVLGPTRGPTLVCAQHGRRFDCTGRFVSQQGFGDHLAEFPRPCDSLTALPVAIWRRLAFVSLDPRAAPLAGVLAPIDASLARMPAMPERMSVEHRDVAGNWKQHAWNYLDPFHIAFVHRAPGGLADAVDLATYTTELHGDSVLQWVYARDPADGFDPAWLPERFADPKRRVFALWWFVFPNLALNFYRLGLSVNVYLTLLDRPDATRFSWYQLAFDRAKHAERDRRWLSAQVDAEDVDALAQVSRGARSGFAPRGRFAPDHERAAHWFHRAVARARCGARSSDHRATITYGSKLACPCGVNAARSASVYASAEPTGKWVRAGSRSPAHGAAAPARRARARRSRRTRPTARTGLAGAPRDRRRSPTVDRGCPASVAGRARARHARTSRRSPRVRHASNPAPQASRSRRDPGRGDAFCEVGHVELYDRDADARDLDHGTIVIAIVRNVARRIRIDALLRPVVPAHSPSPARSPARR